MSATATNRPKLVQSHGRAPFTFYRGVLIVFENLREDVQTYNLVDSLSDRERLHLVVIIKGRNYVKFEWLEDFDIPAELMAYQHLEAPDGSVWDVRASSDKPLWP